MREKKKKNTGKDGGAKCAPGGEATKNVKRGLKWGDGVEGAVTQKKSPPAMGMRTARKFGQWKKRKAGQTKGEKAAQKPNTKRWEKKTGTGKLKENKERAKKKKAKIHLSSKEQRAN